MLTERDLREIEENPWKSFRIYVKKIDSSYNEIKDAVSDARERYLMAHMDEEIAKTAQKFGVPYARVRRWVKKQKQKREERESKNIDKNRPYTHETAYLIRRWAEQGDSIEKIMLATKRSEENIMDAFDPKWDKQVMRCKRRATNYDPGEKISIAMRESKMIKKELEA